MSYLDFVIDHQQSFVIRCSFCNALERKDIPIDHETTRGLTHNTMKSDLSRLAREKGWRTIETTHGIRLNYCVDHVYLLDELIPKERPNIMG